MTIDFSSLVLGPCMDAFSKSVQITPVKSQPLAAPYPARGVWTIDNIMAAMDDGAMMSTRVLKLGIKINEFVIPPLQYDFIAVNVGDLPLGYLNDVLQPAGSTINFVVDKTQPDGQGGMTLILKRNPLP